MPSKTVDIRPTADLSVSFTLAEELQAQGLIKSDVPVGELMMSILGIMRRIGYIAPIEYREEA